MNRFNLSVLTSKFANILEKMNTKYHIQPICTIRTPYPPQILEVISPLVGSLKGRIQVTIDSLIPL